MKILFLTQLLPLPLDAGPKIRSYYTLRYLVESGHEVTVASFRRPSDLEETVSELRRLVHRLVTVDLVRSRARDAFVGVRTLLSEQPFLIARDHTPALHARIQQLCDEHSFDAVHADQLWMAPYAAMCQGPPRRFLDQHNAVFLAVRRMASGEANPFKKLLLSRESVKLEAYERISCRQFDNVVWVSEADRRVLADESRTDHVIPIATDPSVGRRVRRGGGSRVTFIGGMHWPPNAEGIRWFGKSVWPSIAAAHPRAQLTIVGRGAPKEAKSWGGYVDVAGYVDDLSPYLEATAVFVVPLLSGAGMRVKILDAWCQGLPVISTTVGAEGIEARDGENIILADHPHAFAEAVIRVLNDSELATRLGAGGRETVERTYDWRKAYRAWDAIYR